MKGKDAPKVVNVGVWSAAVIGALAFSITLGSYLFGGLDNQISADTETASLQSGEPTQKCGSGTMYTINNYPGSASLLPGGHASYYLEGDKNWRCSYVCVPEGTDLKTYLNGSTAGGKKISLVDNPTTFNSLVSEDKTTAMTSTVILSQSVETYKTDGTTYNRRCTGPNSTDYADIKDADEGAIDTVDRQESAYKETEAARQEAISGAGTIAGTPTPFGAPMSGGESNNDDASSGGNITDQDYLKCKAGVNSFLWENRKYGSLLNFLNGERPLKIMYDNVSKQYKALKKAEADGERSIKSLLDSCNLTKNLIESFEEQRSILLSTKESTTASHPTTVKTQETGDNYLIIATPLRYNGRPYGIETYVLVYCKGQGETAELLFASRNAGNIDPYIKIKAVNGNENFEKVTSCPNLVFYAVTHGGRGLAKRGVSQGDIDINELNVQFPIEMRSLSDPLVSLEELRELGIRLVNFPEAKSLFQKLNQVLQI